MIHIGMSARRVFVTVLAGMVRQTARAGLHWENILVQRGSAGVDVTEVIFAFSNLEKHPVTIVHLQPSCGCERAVKTHGKPAHFHELGTTSRRSSR